MLTLCWVGSEGEDRWERYENYQLLIEAMLEHELLTVVGGDPSIDSDILLFDHDSELDASIILSLV